ncbi:S8 family serine peptidase [Pseudoalteromonas prydzensis]|uniref:S8 family serine peptidase n=1 Tax=Pseudoalteromonas prydzensis TaxID=182141 RepID=UPI0007E4DE55|nr:S8 family serine peptidase [Pseudoalteromonas prydzensis]MBE0377329.1 hypothetical protein [Pseudoalteromonas prydzensis ACAM 620]
MYSQAIKRSAIALAVTSAICGSAQANNNYTKYNLSGQTEFKSTAVTKHTQARDEATSWVVKLKTPATMSASKFGQDIATVKANAVSAQLSVENTIQDMGLQLQVIAKTSTLVSSIIVNGNKANVERLLGNSQVADILPVYDYNLHVADSADYIEATPLVSNGLATGEGVRVAVLDTGIDYTHTAFGGAGTDEAYAAATSDPAAVDWPQGKVLGGYDYINNDADPIDVDTNHGTHVSHSVNGIAPNVDLFVYSVCSDISCPGLAQLQALENAMDPNGDGDIADRVDVVNMSLGGDYGTIAQDAVGVFINEAVKLGTNVVISAGNDGDYPFIVGGPSTTENALSVGAMTHPVLPDDVYLNEVNGEPVESGSASFGEQGEFQFTSEETELVYPDANQTACEDFAEDVDFTGKGVIIDRGACGFSAKALRAQQRGAAFVIIANNAAGPAPGMSAGPEGDQVTIRVISVTQNVGTQLKEMLAADEQPEYTFQLEKRVLEGAIASFTSRGPSMGGGDHLKPEITAPGVNIMTAHPGLGDGLSGATGTSFSGPITAGAVSLLKEAQPERNALELKATLMNTANLNVTMEPRELNPDTALAPISYIGAGLVDVNKAANLPVAAWAKDTKQAALAFGLVNASEPVEITKTIEVKNFSHQVKVYTLSLEQRYQNDIERGSFALDYPETITVPAGQTISFDVTATIDPTNVPAWEMQPSSADGESKILDHSNIITHKDASEVITNVELDGALVFSDGNEPAFHLVYHALPRANAEISIEPVTTEDGTAHKITNIGATTFEPVFAPIVAEDDNEGHRFDIAGGSIETFAVPTDVCSDGYLTTTTVVLNNGVLLNNVSGFMVDFDLDQDGAYDYTVQNGYKAWFEEDVSAAAALTFTHGYGSGSGQLNGISQITGNNHLTMLSCISAFGLTAEDVEDGATTATVRFRVEKALWTPIATNSGDVAMGSYTFRDASEDSYATLEDETGSRVEKLEPGMSAMLTNTGSDFIILSVNGSQMYVATPSSDGSTAPKITDAEFSVDENTATGTVIGSLEASPGADLANPVSEFIVLSSTSTAVSVNAKGDVVVMDQEVLDYDAGLMSVELEVVVTDAAGNISEPAMVTVMVNNLADEAFEMSPQIDDGQMFTVQENAPIGTIIGQLLASDPDADMSPIVSYTVEGHDGIGIDGMGEITVSGAVDYDVTPTIELSVIAVDSAGNASEAVQVTINVTEDALESTPTIEANQSFTVDENTPLGTVIGTLSFNDPDADVTPVIKFEVSGTNLVTVNAAGEIVVAGDIDYEYERSFTFNVVAVDSAGNSSQSVSVDVRVKNIVSNDDDDNDGDSGSLAWLSLLAAPFAFMRRRKQK